MGHYLDGEAGRIFVKMYRGRAIGMSFPTDGDRHYDTWITRKYPVTVDGKETEINIITYEDGTLVSIDLALPKSIEDMETSI